MNVKIEDSKQPDQFNWNKPQLLETKEHILDREVVCFYPETGETSEDWTSVMKLDTGKVISVLKEDFKPFNGTVTLSND